MYKLAVVLRYLRKRKIAFFPVAGVALGVMALVVVLSVMEGFDTDLRGRIRGIMPDLSVEFLDVYGFDPGSADKLSELVARLEGIEGVAAVSPYVSGLALARINVPAADGSPFFDTYSMYVNYRGFDFERERAVLSLDEYMKYGEDPFAGNVYGTPGAQAPLIVGARLVGRLYTGVRTDKEDWGLLDKGAAVQLTTIAADYSPRKVVGVATDVVKSGIWDIDSHILYMPIDYARALGLLGPNTVSGIGLELDDYNAENVAAVKNRIERDLMDIVTPNNYRLMSWEESRRTFLTAVAMERRIMAFILFFFLVVAGFSIAAILVMIVLEKIRDIGILRAMGASSRGIAGVFLTYGVTIGIIGGIVGLALGVAFVENLDVIEKVIYDLTGWEPFPPDIYDLPAIPRILNWWTNLYIGLTAVAVSFLSSILPALRAAWLDPVEAIRYE